MIAVIIAGGSGSRLWPMSTPDYPKHLLSIGEDKRSLLQKTYDRISKTADDIYILPEIGHAHHVHEQLPELDENHIIKEPGRRGTGNGTLLVLSAIFDEIDPDEPIVILWADHYIRDIEGFSHSMRLAATTAKKEEKIVLVGVEPSYPATGFGYIKKDGLVNDEDFVFNVHSFKEKPDFATAESFVRSGKYLWNSGYFIATLNTLRREMTDHAPDMLKRFNELCAFKNYKDVSEYYLKLENGDINYGLIEKVPELLVVPATFDWVDLGSFSDLHHASATDEQGNYVNGGRIELHSVENSFVHNACDKPVAVIGVDNIVVVNTENGILVARKDLSQKIGEVSKKIIEKEKS